MKSLPQTQAAVSAGALCCDPKGRKDRAVSQGEDAIQPWHLSPQLLRHYSDDRTVAWQLREADSPFYSC